MASEPVRKLFITLTRSFAGTRASQRAILESLGFTYRLQTLEKPNTGQIRGNITKVKHLVKVEVDSARAQRLAEEAEKRKPQPHLVIKHS